MNKNNIPTKTGWYWVQGTNRTTGVPTGTPYIVHVCMEFTHRRKVVPSVIGNGWHQPLVDSQYYWSDQILPPSVKTT